VKNDNGDVVDVILASDQNVDIHSALLHAVQENSMEIVQKLLNYKDLAMTKTYGMNDFVYVLQSTINRRDAHTHFVYYFQKISDEETLSATKVFDGLFSIW
jgi:hypothetical protein